MDIRETIINIRAANDLSQQAFAERIDVSRTTVTRWEAGKSIPSSAQIMKICREFDLDPNELFGMPAGNRDEPAPAHTRSKKNIATYVLFGILIFVAAVGLAVTVYYAIKDASYDSSTTVWIMTIPQNTPMIVLSLFLTVFIGLLVILLIQIVRSNRK